LENSGVAERLLALQEGLISMEFSQPVD
jgi:hypothetical protein